ncbi:hypothetical protein HDU84_004943 [Entophlyctis sp. JEL0112]|nr:hypothetical protein HDU84_004943 [Entophlyctis sp. JEL0112]
MNNGIRIYRYQIDLLGRVYLADARQRTLATAYRDPKFLDFFVPRIAARDNDSFAVHRHEEFQYESRCGRELNLIKSDDSPIVFDAFSAEDGVLHWAGSQTTEFIPQAVHFSKSTGRLYHPMPVQKRDLLAPWQLHDPSKYSGLGLALMRSQIVQMHFADLLENDSLGVVKKFGLISRFLEGMSETEVPLEVGLFDEPVSPTAVGYTLSANAQASLTRALLFRRPDTWLNNAVTAETINLPFESFATSSSVNTSIMSLVLFSRVPVIVGSVGILQTVLLALLATSLTLLTAVSIAIVGSGSWTRTSDTAAQPKPKHAGVYFLISHSLGKVVGGGVSCMFYIGMIAAVAVPANTVAIFIMSLDPTKTAFSFASEDNVRRLLGTAFLVVSSFLHPFARVNRTSTRHHISIFSLLAFVAAVVGVLCAIAGMCDAVSGRSRDENFENFANNWGAAADSSFFYEFGIFFPLVTGVLAGSSRATELANPRRDIPRYTIAAQIVTSLIYFLVIILLGFAFARADLVANESSDSGDYVFLMVEMAWPTKWVSVVGCFGLAFGASLQGFTNAAKLLKAIAKDDLLPVLHVFKNSEDDRWFDSLVRSWECRLLGFVIAEITLLVSPVDSVYTFSTVIFLICYVFLNASAATSRYIKSPNWNSTWKYHWSVPAIASLTALIITFLLSLALALGVLGVLLVFVQVIAYYDARQQYGKTGAKGASGILLQIAKRNLWEVEIKEGEFVTGNDWKPHIMLFVKGQESESEGWKIESGNGMEFLAQLKRAGGLAVVCTCLLGDIENSPPVFSKADAIRSVLLQEARKLHLTAFPQVVFSSTLNGGIFSALQCVGIGPLRPNTIMLGWPTTMTSSFAHMVRGIMLLDKALLLVKGINDLPVTKTSNTKPVDIYWMLLDGGIMMLITHILMKHSCWRESPLRVFIIANDCESASHERMKQKLQMTLRGLSINVAESNVLRLDREMDDAVAPAIRMGFSNLWGREESVMSLWEPSDMRVGKAASSVETILEVPEEDDENSESPNIQSDESHVLANSGKLEAIFDARLQLARKINSLIKANSKESRLVVCNLPSPGHVIKGDGYESNEWNYVEYLQVLAQDLDHVMLIKGAGSGVVTQFY